MSRRRLGQGALFIVAMLFASSGALRLGSGAGSALAKAEAEPDTSASEPETASCEMPAALAEALTLREDRVAAKEAALKDRLAALALADAAITKRKDELRAVEMLNGSPENTL